MNKKGKLSEDNHTLDLHNVRHDDVNRIVENFVLLNKPPLTIITGHSDMMTKLVETTLRSVRAGYEKLYNGRIKVFK